MRSRMITAALGLAAIVAIATPAMANHNHPSKANKFLILYVQAYNQCTSPSTTHNAPLAFGACTPVRSGNIVFGSKGFGQTTGVVKLNSLKQATDIQLISKMSDVRVGTSTGPVFTGNLTGAGVIRTTDHFCVTPGECTLIDVPFPVSLPCTAGKCAAKTTANAALAKAVQPGNQANVELQQLQVYNGAELEFSGGVWLP